MLIRSAGAVIIGPDSKIVIVNQNNDSWSLPKGRLEPGETEEQAARREVYEETGITEFEIVRNLGSYERSTIGLGGIGFDDKNMKQITLFLCRTNQLALKPIDPHNPFAEWVDIDEVPKRLHHPKDIEFFNQIRPEIKQFLQASA